MVEGSHFDDRILSPAGNKFEQGVFCIDWAVVVITIMPLINIEVLQCGTIHKNHVEYVIVGQGFFKLNYPAL